MKNYFEILGVSENATDEEIKKQYRILSKKYHPDVNPDGADQFKEIAEAYDVLSDPQKKVSYLAQKENPLGSDSFEDFLKNMFGQNPNFANRRKVPDKIVKLSVSVLESFNGAVKKINYQRNIACEPCRGSGGDSVVCGQCGGNGFVVQTLGSGFFQQTVRSVCPSCQGKGKTIVRYCNNCGGAGTKPNFESVSITIPMGVDDGQFFKLQGKGDFHQEMYGDLVIQVVLEQNGDYQKIGNDLIYNLFLDLNTIKDEFYNIPHPKGDLRIQSPQVFDSTKPLRLRNKGFNGGDMYVKLNVRFNKSEQGQNVVG